RRVLLQKFGHRSRHRRRRGGRDGLLRGRCGYACRREDRAHTHAAPENFGHDVFLLSQARLPSFVLIAVFRLPPRVFDRARRHSVGTMPTRLVNGLATASLPSTILSGSAGKAREAGPSITAAPSRGL